VAETSENCAGQKESPQQARASASAWRSIRQNPLQVQLPCAALAWVKASFRREQMFQQRNIIFSSFELRCFGGWPKPSPQNSPLTLSPAPAGVGGRPTLGFEAVKKPFSFRGCKKVGCRKLAA
jgi:hypothetical protein